MGHDHCHHHVNFNRAFALGVLLNTIYIVVEVGYGLAIGSLALLADAGHNLSDVLGLLLAWAGHYLATLKPTARHTYGFRSSSILAALSNALILLVAIGGIAWEAVRRLADPVEVPGTTVMLVAAIGVVINTFTALLFFKGGQDDLNIRGAFWHMAADAGISLGVVIGGFLTYQFGFRWIDSAISLMIVVVIFMGTWRLLRESLSLALHAVPGGIDPAQVEEYLNQIPGVQDVHDLHIWALSTTETAMTAHLVIPVSEGLVTDQLLTDASSSLQQRFKIHHTTLQIERDADHFCPQASADTV